MNQNSDKKLFFLETIFPILSLNSNNHHETLYLNSGAESVTQRRKVNQFVCDIYIAQKLCLLANVTD